MTHIIVVGAGQAGAQTIISLRQGGFDGDITLIGEEKELPYQRPPLSKKFLSGEMPAERLFFRPAEFYEKENITVKLSCRVETIDRNAKTLTLDDGGTLSYDKLMLSVGSRPRPLPLDGADRPNVFAVRSIADIEAMKPLFEAGKKLIIIGGGYIGLETAAVAQKMGLATTVVEAMDRVLARVTDPQISAFYQSLHREEGVDMRVGTGVEGFEFDETVTGVRLSDGNVLDADLVVVGIGILPNVEMAAAAGLAVDNGIVVNENAQTSDPDIYAGGDCTQHPNALLGRNLRLESVQNAIEQGKAAAAHMLGSAKPYADIPWFWSDQYDVKLQTVGLSGSHDRTIVRGDPATRSFALFYFEGDKLIAMDAINRPAEFMVAKKLVHASFADDHKADPAALADDSIAPKALMAGL
ncbi:MAG: NAD(P)/FAD-dependent oxidoreductase [Parvibaculales bacterium]